MPRGQVKIIHWTDPNYLQEFYKAWGSGQSITTRQEPRGGEIDKTADSLAESGDEDE
jgi:hypothetical protein